MGLYRLHQGSCLPRYDQAANGIYDAQRHETLLLKQRFLEAKAKKTKRNDNRHAPARDSSMVSAVDTKNGIVAQPKLKRAAGSPLLDCAIDDGHQNKIPRNSTPDHSNANPNQQQQGAIPSFSVQIVQQFTSSNTSQAPHSQTIQTNVTVQALSGGSIKTSNSPMTANNVSATASPASDVGNVLCPDTSASNGPSTSISVGTNIECKQEPGVNYTPCSMGGGHAMSSDPNAHANNVSANGNGPTSAGQNAGSNLGDRFSDSLANLGFPEDSSDDVIHPDILKDILDDVFTNPSELMNGFSFVDNMKDNSGSGNPCPSLADGKDTLRTCNGKTSLHPHAQTRFTNANSTSMPQFSVSQSQQAVFDFQTASAVNSNSSLAGGNVTGSQGYSQNRVTSYASANSMNSGNNALGLDFKLTEPSPAAQTLKQMAEQHQNMQQKQQQQLGLAIGNHPRSPFRSDNFSDPLSNIRSNFLNGSSTTVNSLQKSPNSLFQNMPYNQQQNFSNQTVGNVKQEVGSPVPPMFSNMNTPLSELELHKRRQQMLQMQQQQQQQQQPRPTFPQSPDQKPLGIGGTGTYQSSRPLSHYNDPMSVASHGSASSSPISHPGQFMRGVPTPGVTPPPNFSPSPSGATLHLSQSQQMQMSQSNQQLQVSQSQQQLMVNHDLKPTVSPKPQQQQQQQQQQQHIQSRNFYSGHHGTSVQMSQSQSVSFQFGSGNVNRSSPNASQRASQNAAANSATAQRPLQQYPGNRQTPEYQSQMEQNSVKHQLGQQAMNPSDSRSPSQRGRKSAATVVSSQGYVQIDQSNVPQSTNPLFLSGTNVTGSGRGRGGRGNSRSTLTASKSPYLRQQRPPNVNVGPEGLNISQRPPVATDWKHAYMQQQVNPNMPSRVPISRTGMPNNMNPPAPQYSRPPMDAGVNSNTVNCLSSMANSMSQMGDSTLTLQGGMPNVDVPNSNSHMMIQQQQAVLQCNLDSSVQMQVPSNMQHRDHGNLHHQPFANSPKTTMKPLDDSSQGLSSDSNQFLLDFLDTIDCSTSDLLNFDVMHGGGSSFPLLDDVSMLGK